MRASTGASGRTAHLSPNHGPRRGFSLPELLLVLTLLGLLLAQALPAFGERNDRLGLSSVAEELRAHLRQARGLALGRAQPVHVAIRRHPAGWCYGYASAPDCDCAGTSCQIDGVANGTVVAADKARFTAPARFSFSAPRGLSRTGRLRLLSPRGRELRLLRSAFGRIRVCAPDGAVTGYPRC